MMDVVKESRSRIYVPHPELVWVAAEIVTQISTEQYEVNIVDPDVVSHERKMIVSSSGLPVGMNAFPLQNDGLSERGIDDMSLLGFLHEASILDNLRARFLQQLPYTYTGDICIAVNPYQWLDIYADQHK